MEFQLPQGTGDIKHTRPYRSLTPNQKLVYDLCYDEINGPLFFAENCCYVNRNGIQHYEPFDYQREMLFNLRNYSSVISLWSRQNGKCGLGTTKIKVKNKKTNEIKQLTLEDFFNLIKYKK